MRQLLLCLFWLPFEVAESEFLGWMCGSVEPPSDCWNRVKHHWKMLRGILPVEMELDNQRGYLGWKRTYSDGSETFIR